MPNFVNEYHAKEDRTMEERGVAKVSKTRNGKGNKRDNAQVSFTSDFDSISFFPYKRHTVPRPVRL